MKKNILILMIILICFISLFIFYINKDKKIENILKDKNISILGDSISTYINYSNDAVNTNSTIGKNAVYYNESKTEIENVDQTWWKQVIDDTGMNLLVNNSWSGSRVMDVDERTPRSGYLRADNLHDDTGENKGTSPDIVVIYLGTNDFNNKVELGVYNEELYNDIIIEQNDGTFKYKTPSTFTEAYMIMVHKVINNYDNPDIFCFTILPNSRNKDYKQLEKYNDVIRKIANYYGAEIVDLYKDSGITADNHLDYTGGWFGLHPNQQGMSLIANTFKQSLINKYEK